jgi:hypothetical protein
LYRYKRSNNIIIIWIHIDNSIIFSNNQSNLEKLRNHMEGKLRVKWESQPDKLVGLKLDYGDNSIFLSKQFLVDQTIQ